MSGLGKDCIECLCEILMSIRMMNLVKKDKYEEVIHKIYLFIKCYQTKNYTYS